MYKNVTIYYMSGTGNSYRAATWMAMHAQAKGARVRIAPIEKAYPDEEISAAAGQLVGLVMPAHGFTAPWHMLRFVRRLPRGTGAHAFVVCTQAGAKAGPVFIPGMSASASFVTSLILAVKGFRVRGVMGLDMPSNWMQVHSGFHPKSVEAIIARAKPKTVRFTEKILSGKTNWLTLGNVLLLLFGILLLPISFLYLIIGRFFLAKLFFANNTCNGCGICAKYCPVGAVVMRGGENPRPYWRYNCESCMRCMGYCPEKAIEAGHSWAVVLYFITTIPVSMYLINWLVGFAPGAEALNKPWVHEAVNFVYIYPALFISYMIFSVLLRIPVVNSLFTYTTLTHIYRRYHEPEAKLKDFGVERKP